MRFCFLLSTKGGSPLQVGLERGLVELGHQVSYHGDSDVLVVFNHTAHTNDYSYPDFPDCKTVAFVDGAEYGYYCYLPMRARAYANAFATSSMVHDLKNPREQARLRSFLEGKSFPYLLVGYSKYLTYPDGYYPISYPLYRDSACDRTPDLREYLSRERNLFLSWGDNHPWRVGVTKALRQSGCPNSTIVLGEDGRVGQSEYFRQLSECRASVSFDGYGPYSFRTTEVLVRTVLLMGPEHVVSQAPLIDGVHCRRYGVCHNGERFFSTNIAEKLQAILADKEFAFRMYEAGYDHCMTKMTEKATAQYFLDTIDTHDWGKSTPLEVA